MELNSSLGNSLPLCEGCDNTISSFTLLSESHESLMQFLYSHRVLKEKKVCQKCGNKMSLDKKNFTFRCHKRMRILNKRKKKGTVKCGTSVSQLVGTLFENSHISLQIICRFVIMWTQMPHTRQMLLQEEFNISSGTVVAWCNYLREACFHYMMIHSELIGGIGKTVEIYEFKVDSRKYHRGGTIEGDWIFVGIEKNNFKSFIISASERGPNTLLPIIKEYILPGTNIISDYWKTYQCLQSDTYIHLTVNNTYNFIDPKTGTHKQNIVSSYPEFESFVPRYGNRKHYFHTHIAEFLFKNKFNDYKKRLHYLWLAIAELYDKSYSNQHYQMPLMKLEPQELYSEFPIIKIELQESESEMPLIKTESQESDIEFNIEVCIFQFVVL